MNTTGPTIIQFYLNRPFFIEHILVIGNNEASTIAAEPYGNQNKHLSDFWLYVGFDNNYSANTACSGSPYAPFDGVPGTADGEYNKFSPGSTPRERKHGSYFKNGADAECDLYGNNVHFVREATAVPTLNSLEICTFGIIASPRYMDINMGDIVMT